MSERPRMSWHRKMPATSLREAAVADQPKGNNLVCGVFIGACMALLVAPLVFMPLSSGVVASEKRELAPLPELMADDSVNLNFLSEAGDYFCDHFAFRSLLVDMDATIKQVLFCTSSADDVVVGYDGWLYYAGTLNDYQRKNSLSDHALNNIACNVSLMQEYFTAQGKTFVLAIAPNKNELYPEHMPYYEIAGEGESNVERLLPLLRERGIVFADLHEAFRGQSEVLYFMRDSHWDDRGAILAYETIMRSIGREPVSFDEGSMMNDEHLGDIDAMLHPVFAEPEAQERSRAVDEYEVTNDATGVEDGYIITKAFSASTSSSLIMFRDSFGNNLMPPFASTYAQAVFTKLVPYDMGLQMTGFAQDVIVERTERHLAFFATDPPYMPAPERAVTGEGANRGGDTTVHMEESGSYVVVEGTLDSNVVGENERVLVQVMAAGGSLRTFEAFHVSEQSGGTEDFEGDASESDRRIEGDWGYRAYIPSDVTSLDSIAEVRILVGEGANPDVVCSTVLT